MARSASKKSTFRRHRAAPLSEAMVEARAVALGLPRFAVRLAAGVRLKPTPGSWPRRHCE
ncbi:hypothetical protein NXS98_09770 [Fontisphaera persica]|uniref:hypothetical protein n=1 Tax=Fontisphaera persica TaxID=2974023 RepID=UPI0024BF3CF7|nr:hypothetical protein [Fontisphaera persica]WCJ58015.1 hypothetical protein NXS98_09770 [Fontisphaera persica]